VAGAAWSAGEALAAGRQAIDGAALPACAAAIDATHCDFASRATLGPVVLDATTLAPKLITPYTLTACAGALVGKVPAGGGCKADVECRDGRCDNRDTPGCAGTCVARSAPVPAYPGLGESCPTGDCAPGLYCDVMSLICRERLAAGSPCTPDGDPCADGLSCTSAGCRAWSDVGQVCSEDADCAGDAFCDGGACKLWGQLGDNCSAINCTFDLYCNAQDQCTKKSAFGGSCETVDACLGGGCSNGTCALICS